MKNRSRRFSLSFNFLVFYLIVNVSRAKHRYFLIMLYYANRTDYIEPTKADFPSFGRVLLSRLITEGAFPP